MRSRKRNWQVRFSGLESLEERRLLAVVTIPAMQDTTLYESPTGALANGSGEHFFVGRTGQPEGLSIRRGLLQFDVAGRLPQDAAINDVQLVLNMSRTTAGPSVVSLHRVLNAWSTGASDAARQEGTGAPAAPGDATWIHRDFPAPLWNNPGGDFLAGASGAATVSGVGQYSWSTPGMIDDVQDWLDLPNTNFGWLLKGDEQSGRTSKRFDTRENGTAGNRPMLIIDFEGQATPTVSIVDAVAAPEGDDGATSMGFPVTLSQNPQSPVTVFYTTSAITATSDEDYVDVTGELVFQPDGPLTQNISVFVRGDRTFEDDETFQVTITDVSGGELNGTGEAIGTIENDDPLPTIEFDDSNVEEIDAGSEIVDVEIRLSNPSENEITADYLVVGDTATPDEDFVATGGQVTFPPGENVQTISIELLGDLVPEEDETLRIEFTNVQNAELSRDSLLVTIVDNDEPREHPWQNPSLAEDVDGDGLVVPLDALLVINRLNSIGAGPLPIPTTPEDRPPPFFDVSGDDFLSPIDALLVINLLNSQAARGVAATDAALDGTGSSLLDGAISDPLSSGDLAMLAGALQDDLRFNSSGRSNRPR